jgi:hypothetical protein
VTYEHVIKADDILEQPYLNPAKKYGMFYQVDGMLLLIRNSMQLYEAFTGSVYFLCKAQF